MSRSTMHAIGLTIAAALLASTTAQAGQWPGLHYSGQQAPPNNGVTYGFGGIMSGTIDVYLIYYGGWSKTYQHNGGTFSAATDETIINTYFNDLGQSSFFKIASTYFDDQGRRPTGLNFAGAWVVPFSSAYNNTGTFLSAPVKGVQTPTAWTSPGFTGNLALGGGVIDNGSTLLQLIHDQIKQHSIANPNNSIFIVLPAPDIMLWDYTNGFPALDACGFHNAMPSQFWSDLTGFAHAPIYGTGSAITSGCDVGDYQPFDYPNSPQADLQINETSHELLEAITDPFPNSGWNPEIGDGCGPGGPQLTLGQTAWGPAFPTNNSITGAPAHATIRVGAGNYVVQRMWVNNGGGYCGFAPRVPGDFDGDGMADLVNFDEYLGFLGSMGDTDEYVAYSNGDGSFRSGTMGVNFDIFAAQSGARTITGDFIGNGKTGLASAGGLNWHTVPVAAANTLSHTWSVFNNGTDFNAWLPSGAKLIAGDWGGDGLTDLATLSASGTPCIAQIYNEASFGAGLWSSTICIANTMGQLGYAPFVVSGDFNGDGRTDIAATGVSWWQTVPVAISNGDGTFHYVNATSTFAGYTAQAGAKVVVGDFDGDGLDDIATVGGASTSNNVTLALSRGDGTFRVVQWSSNFYAFASQANVRVISGDFDGDGRADLTAVGGQGWITIPIAFSRGSGNLRYFSAPTNQWSSVTQWFTSHSSNGGTQTLSSWESGTFH